MRYFIASLAALIGIFWATLNGIERIDLARNTNKIENARQELLIDCMLDGYVVVNARVFRCAAFPSDGQPIPERAPTLQPKKGPAQS